MSPRRRDVLSALGLAGIGGSSGCIDASIDDSFEEGDGADRRSQGTSEETPTPTDDAISSSELVWPTFQGNSRNSGHSRAVSGPSDAVTERWRVETEDDGFSSPVVADGTVFATRTDQSRLDAFDAETGTTEWSLEIDSFSTPTMPVVTTGYVYVGLGSSLFVVDPATGDTEWTLEIGSGLQTPTEADGTLYVADDDRLFALDARDGTEKWRFQQESIAGASPAVGDESVFVGGDDSYVYALDADDGSERWSVDVGRTVRSRPTIFDGVVLVAMGDSVLALDGTDGTELWELKTSWWLHASPAVVDGVVYAGSGDNFLYALDIEDGTEKWRFETDSSQVYSSPVVVDGTAYFGSHDDHVYALDADDGSEKWRFGTGDDVVTSPAVGTDALYVTSRDGNLYGLTEP